MQNLKDNLSILGQVAVAYIMLDVVMFFTWVFSGQVGEGFYLGKITAEILRAIII